MQRWVLTNLTTSATWTVPRNPNTMNFPSGLSRQIDTLPPDATGRMPAQMSPASPVDVSFGGSLVDGTHYDTLLSWVRADSLVQITDHLGRSWKVILLSIKRTPRRRGPNNDWTAGTYVVKGSLVSR